MAEIIGVKVDLQGGEAIKTVGTLRQQLKAALIDLQGIQEQFGDISPEAIAAAKGVAQLRDSIKDANEVASLFDPEKKFQAVVGVAQGIASGFAAAQGAMALFGAESEQVEKAILKVQAAMALAQGLSGLNAAIEDFKRLGGVIKNLSVIQGLYNFVMNGTTVATTAATAATTGWTVALRVLRGALVSTGIGAIVVLLGTLVAQLMEATESTNEFAEALARSDKEAQDFANSTSDAIVAMFQKQSEMAVARAEAEGKSAKEIFEIQKKYLDMIARERRANVENQKNDNLDASEARKKADDADTASQLASLKQQAKDRQDAAKKRKEAEEKAAADRKATQKAVTDAEKQTADEVFAIQHSALENELRELNEKFKLRFDIYQKAGKDITDLISAQVIERAAIIKRYQDEQAQREKEAADKKFRDTVTATEALQSVFDEAHENDLKRAAAQKQFDQLELDRKRGVMFATADILNSLSSLAGEQTAAGKVLAIASATIATYTSAQQAYLSAFLPFPTPASPILAPLLAAAAGLAGLNNIKRIAAVQIPGQSGAGANVPSISSAAPLVPQGPQTTTTRLDQDSINNIGSAMPVRAYVVESDITEAQARMKRIKDAAKFE